MTAMLDETDHSACVNSWMKRAAQGLPPELLVDALQQGFDAIWQRAYQTLGDVTLMAIADRVLFSAAEQFPTLSGLKIEATGLQCGELRERARSLRYDELAVGVRFVLVEFLTVLGNLTAQILTPALHSALSKAGPKETVAAEKESRDDPQNPEPHGEDPES